MSIKNQINPTLPLKTLLEIRNKIYNILDFYNFSKAYNLKINENYIDWEIVSKDFLSEDFIREFKDKVNWEKISKYQKLSESFIIEFENKVYWKNIFKYQVILSKSLLKKYYKNEY